MVFGQVASPTAGAAAPAAGRGLAGKKFSSPSFGGDARPLGRNRDGTRVREVAQDLPTDRWIRIEEPFEVRGPGCVIVQRHSYGYSKRCVGFHPAAQPEVSREYGCC